MDEDLYFIFEELLTDDEEEVINVIEAPRNLRVFRERPNYMALLNNEEFVNRFRLSKNSVEMLLCEIHQSIEHPTNLNHALTPLMQLLITLRFYATGSFVLVASDFGGTHKSTACRVIKNVSEAIANLAPHYIKMPNGEEELSIAKHNFLQIARFPDVIGAIDCTHIRIISPGGDNPEHFRNRKGWFSLNVQTVSDANLKIINIVARWPGSASDRTIFANCRLKAQLEEGLFDKSFLLGDSGYTLTKYLMIPVANPVTRPEHCYNESQIRTRNVVERQYGVWKRRFPVLRLEMRLKLETVQTIIIATAVLHNIAITNNDDIPVAEPHQPYVNQIHDIAVDNNDINAHMIRQSLINDYFANLH